MKEHKQVLCLLILLFSGVILAQDAKVAGKCVTCHNEKSLLLYLQPNIYLQEQLLGRINN